MIQMQKVNLSKVKKTWLKMEKENENISPFQYFNFTNILANHYLFFCAANLEFPFFIQFTDGNKVICIAPLCHRYRKSANQIVSFGTTPTIAFQNFVSCKEMTVKEMIKCLVLLKNKYGTLLFNNVPPDSLLKQALDMLKKQPVKDHINIAIPLDGTYEQYFSRLSKSTRQNVRTAYNRMKKAGAVYEILVIQNGLKPSELRELMNIYIVRRREKYRYTSKLHEWFLRHYHFNTIGFQRMENARYVILKINGKIAAFLAGYKDRQNKSLIIPRLAINSEFSMFSPGIVLINESMKILRNVVGVEILDLSKGYDKYKLVMGGEIYYTFDYIFC
jgi:hypothetical protein